MLLVPVPLPLLWLLLLAFDEELFAQPREYDDAEEFDAAAAGGGGGGGGAANVDISK